MSSSTLDQLFDDISRDVAEGNAKLPPVEKWNPPLSGDIDIVIKRDGTWLHEGDPINRQGIVRVFSSILKREGDDYFLVTPVEKWRIRVEDAPFQIVGVEAVERNGVQALVFETSVGDRLVAGPDHPIRVLSAADGEPSPYVYVRNGMEGLLNRPVFYELAEQAVSKPEKEKAVHGVYSLGEFFPLE